MAGFLLVHKVTGELCSEAGDMPSEIIRDAIKRRLSLTATYEDYLRHFSPNILGWDQAGEPAAIVFQYAGGQPGGLPAAGDWCFFRVDRLRSLRPNTDKWVTGPLARRPGHLLAKIDVSA
jgi:hypothetical protein